jgi:hypothetical protein
MVIRSKRENGRSRRRFWGANTPGALDDQHRERIDLLAGGAGRHPNPNLRVRIALRDQRRHYRFVKCRPSLQVAEKPVTLSRTI